MRIRGAVHVDPGSLPADGAGGELELVVPYTGPETTAAALARVALLTAGLNARILLLAVHTLPYPVPLVSPSLVHAHLVDQLMELAGASCLPVESQIILARDRMEGFRRAMKAGSTVILASRRPLCRGILGRTEQERLARELAGIGHTVMLVHIV